MRGEDITGLSPDRISQRGVARSYRITNILPNASTLAQCRAAVAAMRLLLDLCLTMRTGSAPVMIYQQLINGLMLGASYSLVAIGYTLIFGVLRLLYFAHGEVFMVGAFIGLFVVVFAGAGISGALLGAMVGCAALGVDPRCSSRSARYRKDRPLAPLISNHRPDHRHPEFLGVLPLIGGRQLAFPETIAQKLYHFGPVTISLAQLFILGVALALMVMLWLFIERSKTRPRYPRQQRKTTRPPRCSVSTLTAWC